MAENAGETEVRLARVFGPAAAWRLRDGVAGRGLAVPGGATRYFTALLQLPDGRRLAPLYQQTGAVRVLPLTGEPDRGGDGPRLVPVILEFRRDVRSLSLNALAETLEGLLRRAFPGVLWGERGLACLLGEPVAEAAVATPRLAPAPQWAPDPALAARKPRAIVAVIDDGIPFAHRALRDRGGAKTRMEFCWLQGTGAVHAPGGGAPPYGREYLRDEIDALITAHGRDEDRLYHAAGATTPRYAYGPSIGRFGTHGSHIVGRAAGDGWHEDSDHIRLIAVQLAPATTLDTTGGGALPRVVAALRYVLDKAALIEAGYGCQDLPLIINFSYGYTGGPHDGSGALATAIRAMIDGRKSPTALVLPAGNTFQSRLNGRVEVAGETLSADVAWRIQPNDRTASPLEFWLAPGADPAELAVDVLDPTGFPAATLQPGDLLDPGAIFVVRNAAGADIGQIYSLTTATRRCFAIALVPSETPAGLPQAAAGRWTIRLRSKQAAALGGPIDCRIQRDFNPIGYFQGARQSYFDPGEPLYDHTGRLKTTDEPNGFLRRFGTLNDLASDAAHTIVVGARYEAADRPAPYSSAGASDGSEPAVDCTAPADTGPALAGRRGAGTRSGSSFRLSGTSVAAPGIARAFAALYRTGQPLVPPQPDEALGPVKAADLGFTPRANGTPQDTARGGRFEPDPATWPLA
jgi:hypothetical protein